MTIDYWLFSIVGLLFLQLQGAFPLKMGVNRRGMKCGWVIFVGVGAVCRVVVGHSGY
jgi:hypothetical protein